MRSVLGDEANGRSFEGMVNLSVEKGHMDHNLQSDLVQLKNHRRDAKHRGQGISTTKMAELLPSVLSAAHRLTKLARE